jgi:hypothetical protein
VIHGNRGFTIGIANRSLDDSAELIKEIFDFAETDRFVKEVRWSMGDIIISSLDADHQNVGDLEGVVAVPRHPELPRRKAMFIIAHAVGFFCSALTTLMAAWASPDQHHGDVVAFLR